MPLKDFNETYDIQLRDPEYVAIYLRESFKDGQESFLLALRDVARANGMSKIAKDSALNRESLYKSLSAGGDPKLRTITAVLNTMGLQLTIEPKLDIDKAA